MCIEIVLWVTVLPATAQEHGVDSGLAVLAVHRVNGMKGSIYMVFDYMDHDLTGLMEREGHNFTTPQVSLCAMSAELRY